MSRQVIVRKRDDLNPELDADETIEIAYEGMIYNIDLCEENATVFREFLAPYLAAAFDKVKVPKAPAEPRKGKNSDRALDPEVRENIRVWAAQNSCPIPQGAKIIGYDIRLAYYDATGDEGVMTASLENHREKLERAKMREWALGQGMPVGSYIGKNIREAYERAHVGEHISEARTATAQMTQKFLEEPHIQEARELNLGDLGEELALDYRGRAALGGANAKSLAIPDPQLRAAIREWAVEQGYHMGKGFIKREIQDAYAEAHKRNGANV